jgi:hypothetical protein
MTKCIHTLFSAWGDPNSDGRARKTDAAIDSSFYYCDPNVPTPLSGRDDYLGYITQFGQMMPGASAEVVAISEHHGHVRATVDFLKDGKPMMRGHYFGDIKDGKVTRLIGFPGTGEPD